MCSKYEVSDLFSLHLVLYLRCHSTLTQYTSLFKIRGDYRYNVVEVEKEILRNLNDMYY